jgi:uncharacterized protein YjbJ (UPF0337 family)
MELEMTDKQTSKGEAKKVEGSLKESASKALNDKELEAEGKADKAEGEVRKGAGKAKDALKD